jgi:DNA-binding response OmpR family regulator
VDDSPHAQRMGERILSDEGYEVVTVSNADSALIRLEDVDPGIVIADTVMPGRTGYDICQYVKISPRHRHVRVILTAGVLETLDEDHCRLVGADGLLKKPFEATVLLATVKPLAESAAAARAARPETSPSSSPGATPRALVGPFIAVVDEEQVRAAVTVALDASMASMVDEITRRVLALLASKKPEAPPGPTPAIAPIAPAPSKPAPPEPVAPSVEPVRRVTPIRLRTSSILGLDVGPGDSES